MVFIETHVDFTQSSCLPEDSVRCSGVCSAVASPTKRDFCDHHNPRPPPTSVISTTVSHCSDRHNPFSNPCRGAPAFCDTPLVICSIFIACIYALLRRFSVLKYWKWSTNNFSPWTLNWMNFRVFNFTVSPEVNHSVLPFFNPSSCSPGLARALLA